MENRAEAVAVHNVRPVLDENAPCPSAKTPTHLQANCGARNLRARFDQRERVSSKGACDRRARTKNERRRHHASFFLKLRLVLLLVLARERKASGGHTTQAFS